MTSHDWLFCYTQNPVLSVKNTHYTFIYVCIYIHIYTKGQVFSVSVIEVSRDYSWLIQLYFYCYRRRMDISPARAAAHTHYIWWLLGMLDTISLSYPKPILSLCDHRWGDYSCGVSSTVPWCLSSPACILSPHPMPPLFQAPVITPGPASPHYIILEVIKPWWHHTKTNKRKALAVDMRPIRKLAATSQPSRAKPQAGHTKFSPSKPEEPQSWSPASSVQRASHS